MPVMGRVEQVDEYGNGALATTNGNGKHVSSADRALLQRLNERRKEALKDRRRYEPTWHLCQSFLAGRQWVGWNNRTQRIVEIPNPQDRERHTTNVITPYHTTLLGKLTGENLRPELAFTRSDSGTESVAEHTGKVANFIWESEVNGLRRAYLLIHKELTYGTSALRCYYDRSTGDKVGDLPKGPDGQMITDLPKARAYVAQAQQQGIQVEFESIFAGRTRWEVLSPFNILPPPGVEDAEYFPWLIIERPTPIETAKLRYSQLPDDLQPQQLRVPDARELADPVGETGIGQPAGGGALKGHIMISTYYELPSRDHPQGLQATFTEQQLLEQTDGLPYNLRGDPHHGVFISRFHLVDGRFWGKGVVEDLIGPQRQRNKARSQMIEMKDRNLGRVYARKGTLTAQNMPTGKVMELIEVPLHADFPQETFGTAPGPWIENEARINDQDMEKVAGLRDVSMGSAPQGVSAYASLALLSQADDRRIGPSMTAIRAVLADAMLVSLEIAKKYWPDGKQLAIVGSDGTLDAFNYSRTMLPSEFYVSISKASPLPSDPAAEAQRIFDIFNAAISAGAPLPPEWLKESLDAGRALPFPKREGQVQQKKAQMENYLMSLGELQQVDFFDDDQIHLKVHRAERFSVQAVPSQAGYVQLLETHEQLHAENMQQKPTSQGSLPARGTQTSLPSAQGGHGIEAQNGAVLNQQGAAQTASGQAPVSMPSGSEG